MRFVRFNIEADVPHRVVTLLVADEKPTGDDWLDVTDQPDINEQCWVLAGQLIEPPPGPTFTWVDGAWVEDPELTQQFDALERVRLQALVDVERDSRIDAGIEFQGVTFQSRSTDRENIAGAAQLAFMAVVAGAQAGDLRWSSADADFTWIASDNTLVPMDAQTVVAFGKAAAERKQALIFAARQLKDMAEIPADYTDDKWWP